MSDANIDSLLQDIVGGNDFNTSIDNYIHNILYPAQQEATTRASEGHPSRSSSQGGSFTPDAEGYIGGRAATFATPSDLSNYARTGSLATGDNGRGAFGHNTAETAGVAIPRDVLESVYGSTKAAAGRPVEVILPGGAKHILPVIDVAPRVKNRANNAVLEFSGGAVKQLGLGDMNGVRYKFLQ